MTTSIYATCVCGEPLLRVESPFDGVWRWRHQEYGFIRDHVATPKHQPTEPGTSDG